MTKEELEQLKSTVKQWLFHTGSLDPTNYANELKLKFIEPREKQIATLEEKISILLSCKNCSENKGGFICQKEYEDKCLAQKIQYIKELKEENENLKKTYRKQRNKRIDDLQKENAELDCQKNRNKFCYSCANATERCFKNEIGCPCGKYKSYKDENAELKTDYEVLSCSVGDFEELQDKLEEEQRKNNGLSDNLTKAKEIINDLVHLGEFNEHTDEEHTNYQVHEVLKNAEQFLKDCEIEK